MIIVKQSLYKPGQALWVPGGWGSQISRQCTHEDCKVVSPVQWLPLPPPQKIFLTLISVKRLSWTQSHSIARRLCQWKIAMTPLGYKPMTFQLISQCLNQLNYCMPPKFVISTSILFRMWNVLDKAVHKIKIHILSSITFHLKIMLFMR